MLIVWLLDKFWPVSTADSREVRQDSDQWWGS
jgi:hypothetical protein